ncbi:hypothetical protein [Polaribacter sp. MED152]|uniref:hypothetical protein n=1 Tax=Polaribacter sp. MED152 TaxID=313598 RepID=UPI00006899B4|nr:hypothetical protein [Polaribacter sp. MED152]EAQ40840.1 hypothetical protein MED152_12419 [Polaribacter sp. MED152]
MFRKILLILALCFAGLSYSQSVSLEKYQYIIVPNQFDFVNSVDAYQTSSLTKFLLQKKGFPVFLSNENIPDALSKNKCAALIVSVKDDSSMLQTKNYLEAKDCFGKVIYTSKIGKSKFKDYKKAYHASIREAVKSMTNFRYSYVDVNSIKAKDKEVVAAVISDDVYEKVLKEVKQNKQLKEGKIEENTIKMNNNTLLYAQEIPEGFQLVNETPKIVYTLLKTNNDSIFILKNLKGIVYKKGDKWQLEYYIYNRLIQEELRIKF